PYLKATAELGIMPERCLTLEDSHAGVRSAHAAGTMTVMIPDLLNCTDELRGLCVAVLKDLHEARELLLGGKDELPAILSTRSASRSGASSVPTDRAACAMAASRAGSVAMADSSAERRSGVNSSWHRRMAPPAFSITDALASWSWSSAC